MGRQVHICVAFSENPFFFLLFSGSQKANKRITGAHEWTEDYIRENKSTVQGALETMMLCLKPYSEVVANFASR